MQTKTAMQTVKAGALYFSVVFGAGVALGTLRVLWVAPRFGARAAELMELPVMLAISMLAARWIVRRLQVPSRWTRRLGVGGIALALVLIAEFMLALGLRGLSSRSARTLRRWTLSPRRCTTCRWDCSPACLS